MDEKTLKKLMGNPHYKLNTKQKAEAREIDRKPMIEFGVPDFHANTFLTHDTQTKHKKRTKPQE